MTNALQHDIADGSGEYEFGLIPEGMPDSRTFTIQNTGNATLAIDINSFVYPSGFSLASPPASTVAPGQSTTFTLQLDAVTAGTYSGVLSFLNSDDDESPYNFTVSGTVTSSGGGGGSPPTVANPFSDLTVDEDSIATIRDLSTIFADADLFNGDSLSFTVSTNAQHLVVGEITDHSLKLHYVPDAHGVGVVTVRATDSTAQFVEDQFQVTVNPVNDLPTVATPLADLNLSKNAPPVYLSLYEAIRDSDAAEDPGQELTYTAASNSNPGLVSATVVGSMLILQLARYQYGAATLTVRGTDNTGAFVEDEFSVNVAQGSPTPVTLENVRLVNDTGMSDDDRVTMLSLVTGTVTGDFQGGGARVEFDHNEDGVTDGS